MDLRMGSLVRILAVLERDECLVLVEGEEVIYECIGKGGRYVVIGKTIGAGYSRGESVIVYKDEATGQLFHRTEIDFKTRMQEIKE